MMNVPSLLLYLVLGATLGLFYFGGLWLTVRRAVGADRPKTWLALSFVGRLAIVGIGFYAIIQSAGIQWSGIAASVLGFVGARFVLVRRLGTAPSVDPQKA